MSENGMVQVSAHTRDGHKVSSYERSKPGSSSGGISPREKKKKIENEHSLELSSTVSGNGRTEGKDIVSTKLAMEKVGYYKFPDYVTNKSQADYMDNDLVDGIKLYQKDKGLPVTGKIEPGDLTHQRLNIELSGFRYYQTNDKAFFDLLTPFEKMQQNFDDMNKTGVKGGDKYFHCKSNWEAANAGVVGIVAAPPIHIVKELKDISTYGIKDSMGDMKANIDGYFGAINAKTLGQSCEKYRPRGVSRKY